MAVAALALCTACSPAGEPDNRQQSAQLAQAYVASPMANERDSLQDAELIAQAEASGKLTADLARQLRAAAPDGRLAVIVEIAGPRPKVHFEPQTRRGETTLRPKSIDAEQSSTDTDGFEQAVAYFESRRWSGHTPVFIKAASAVSLTVSPAELMEIVAQPFVRQISLNQRHRP